SVGPMGEAPRGHVPPELAEPKKDLERRPLLTVGVASYLISTVAPTSSNFFLMVAASSLVTPSLTTLGAPSTRSLASLRPRLVTSRTTLITLIFLSPAAVRCTANSVFSSAGAAAAPPAAAAAPPAPPAAPPPPPPTTPGAAAAAAETPHFSSSIFTSSATCITVSPLR